MTLNKVDADIKTAESNISAVGNPTNDEAMYDIAAYHVQQGIEKLLKILLSDVFGMDSTTKRFRTHSITMLISILEDDYDFIDIPDGIREKSITITDWEAQSRYGDDLVASRNEIVEAISLYYELRKIVVRELEREQDV